MMKGRGSDPYFFGGDMMDVYCRICGEPWDVLSVKEDFTEEQRKMFFKGKGCPACKGIPTMYCENCERSYKGWMRRDMMKEEIELVWELKLCLECGSKLRIATFSGEHIESLVDCDGAIEDVIGLNVLDFVG
jgi:NAD-dependent SIR2 family protein deacetylase